MLEDCPANSDLTDDLKCHYIENTVDRSTTTKTKKSPSSTTLSSQLFLSNHHKSCRCGLHHSILKPVLLSVCNQTILSDLQATRRSGSIERSCVIIPSEFSSFVHQIEPTYLEIGRDRTGTPSVLGQSPADTLFSSHTRANVFSLSDLHEDC